MTGGPREEWKSLDWAKATKKVAVYESWEGCPAQTEDGAHFLGHGRILLIIVDNINIKYMVQRFMSMMVEKN